MTEEKNTIEETSHDAPMLKIAIVGTRRFDNYNRFKELVLPALAQYKYDTIVSGCAAGIDTLARRLARELGKKMVEFPPGNKSPLKRNTKIAQFSDIVIAMPCANSTGTYDTIRKAQKMNKQVVKIKI
jgi:predicted Rossmann fold nucleotide-binding protein DprA/Smf involved in DNA uptake